MQSVRKLLSLSLVSVVFGMSACAKEVETQAEPVVTAEVKQAVVVEEPELSTITTVAKQDLPSNGQVTAAESTQVTQVAMAAEPPATAGGRGQWVKVESDDQLQVSKPSGTYAVPVADELELDSVEEFLGLNQHRGKVVYLDFWASWCVPCRDSFPFMNKVQKKYKDDLVVLAVNLDENKSNAEKFLEKYPANFEIIYDQLWQAGREYGIYGLPFSFVYNRKGELVGKHGGFKDGDEINLDAALKNLIASGE